MQRERDAGASHGGQVTARRATAGWFDFQDIGAQIGEQPGHPVGVGAAEVQHPQGREQGFAVVHAAPVANNRSAHSRWASVPVAT